jgi:hypothetical protein
MMATGSNALNVVDRIALTMDLHEVSKPLSE